MEEEPLSQHYVGSVHRSSAAVCSCVGASPRDASMLSTLSMAVLSSLVRYAQVILTEVISSQYNNTPIFQRHSQNRWRRRRPGIERKKERKKEEARKVGSEDEGKRGGAQLLDWSACVLSAEEECRVEGEWMKNKQTNTRGDKWERAPSTRQRNEAIGVQDLVMNSRRLSFRSSDDGLWPPSIWQTALHLSSVSLTDWEMLHAVTEWRRLWLLCDQPWGSKIIYKRFPQITTFLNWKTQNTHYFCSSEKPACITRAWQFC